MRFGWLAGAAVLAAGAAYAQDGKVTVVMDGVKGSKGDLYVALCPDPKEPVLGCKALQGKAKAQAGQTTVTIGGVKPGAYALTIWHDENGDGRAQIPPEGYAFGNDAPWPVDFKAAAIQVSGDTTARVKMVYGAQPATVRQGSKGAPAPEGVTKIDLREKGLYGELYVPEHKGRLPAIVLIGGSEGGVDAISGMAPSFAKQGYAVLALAYWAEQGLPQTLENIPLEYFDRAVDWLKARPEVDGKAIGAVGWSRGSEAALLLGSRNKDVRAVVAVAPSGIIWQGINFADFQNLKPAWTANGKPLPYVATTASAYRADGPLAPVYTLSLPEANRRPETAIPVERTNGPILLISGGDDRLWPSAEMSDRVIARLQGARFPHSYEHLSYQGAGHVIFVGEPDGLMAVNTGGANPYFGGTVQANRKAWADNWPKTVAFFDKALKRTKR